MTPRETWRRVFATRVEAEAYLAERGFSVGRMQGPARRGIMLGDWDIQKWRNLRTTDRAALHGDMLRLNSDAHGPVAVTIYTNAPVEAHVAIRADGRVSV